MKDKDNGKDRKTVEAVRRVLEGGRRQTGQAAGVQTAEPGGEAGARSEPVDRSRWKDVLDRFSLRNSGRAVTIQTRVAGQNEYRALVTDTVLGGVSLSGSTARDLSVSILMGTAASRHATRTISPVHELLLVRSGRGVEQGLEIVSADNLRTRLMFSGS
jgi:hypothetical protein